VSDQKRILAKVAKVWKKHPGKRLIELLQTLEKDPDPRLDPYYLDDAHLEELLDSQRVKKNKMKVSFGDVFTFAFHSIRDESRAEIENFIRDLLQMTKKEILENQGTRQMQTKPTHYSVKLQKNRIIFEPNDEGVVLVDILSEASIRSFKKAFRAKA